MLVVDGVDVMDVREAAAYVGRTPETVRRWVWSGRVPSIRQGNRLLIARADLDAVASGSAASGDAPITLREWAAQVPRSSSRVGGSAASLVTDERWSDDDGR